ncbi:MAG: sulfate ABC transporter substrate-binding protein [Alysiella sp.]|uniref:sulfate ABC transporter substrate-binding protein n=1 Tax=Alysiella sp. TaxID=1872483 RepID=UPI0026DAC4BB|nr:sulfate ABC transporter substrate-binding protein [Alysiella sp.]MDO4433683.1 sulfate ABC transporter substrate-binding protein [Alysiella sp.]
MIFKNKTLFAVLGLGFALAACGGGNKAQNNPPQQGAAPIQAANATQILNVSYDVMRDFYKEFNPLFIKHYQAQGKQVDIQQSHGGSSKQALSVANGLKADVVTMNQSSDIELLEKKGLVSKDWQQKLPNHAVPFTSTTVFLVRKGNPKNIKNWADLTQPDVKLVIANPKTSGNGRYTFLAAYGYALKENANNHDAAKVFTQKLFANAVVLEAGGRGATTSFIERKMGDALITFENEANLAAQTFGKGEFEIVYPSYSIAMESPVAVVNGVADKKGTAQIAHDYLAHLWSDEAQELAAKLYLRPSKAEILAKHEARFPKVETFRANDVFGSWDEIMKTHFADGGVFDQINKR